MKKLFKTIGIYCLSLAMLLSFQPNSQAIQPAPQSQAQVVQPQPNCTEIINACNDALATDDAMMKLQIAQNEKLKNDLAQSQAETTKNYNKFIIAAGVAAGLALGLSVTFLFH